MSCIFCRIIAGEIPATIEYQDDACVVIRDIAPAAPIHLLVIPKVHVSDMGAVADMQLFVDIFAAIQKVVATQPLSEGYRVVTNVGDHGGQTVSHLHFHILGGDKLGKMA